MASSDDDGGNEKDHQDLSDETLPKPLDVTNSRLPTRSRKPKVIYHYIRRNQDNTSACSRQQNEAADQSQNNQVNVQNNLSGSRSDILPSNSTMPIPAENNNIVFQGDDEFNSNNLPSSLSNDVAPLTTTDQQQNLSTNTMNLFSNNNVVPPVTSVQQQGLSSNNHNHKRPGRPHKISANRAGCLSKEYKEIQPRPDPPPPANIKLIPVYRLNQPAINNGLTPPGVKCFQMNSRPANTLITSSSNHIFLPPGTNLIQLNSIPQNILNLPSNNDNLIYQIPLIPLLQVNNGNTSTMNFSLEIPLTFAQQTNNHNGSTNVSNLSSTRLIFLIPKPNAMQSNNYNTTSNSFNSLSNNNVVSTGVNVLQSNIYNTTTNISNASSSNYSFVPLSASSLQQNNHNTSANIYNASSTNHTVVSPSFSGLQRNNFNTSASIVNSLSTNYASVPPSATTVSQQSLSVSSMNSSINNNVVPPVTSIQQQGSSSSNYSYIPPGTSLLKRKFYKTSNCAQTSANTLTTSTNIYPVVSPRADSLQQNDNNKSTNTLTTSTNIYPVVPPGVGGLQQNNYNTSANTLNTLHVDIPLLADNLQQNNYNTSENILLIVSPGAGSLQQNNSNTSANTLNVSSNIDPVVSSGTDGLQQNNNNTSSNIYPVVSPGAGSQQLNNHDSSDNSYVFEVLFPDVPPYNSNNNTPLNSPSSNNNVVLSGNDISPLNYYHSSLAYEYDRNNGIFNSPSSSREQGNDFQSRELFEEVLDSDLAQVHEEKRENQRISQALSSSSSSIILDISCSYDYENNSCYFSCTPGQQESLEDIDFCPLEETLALIDSTEPLGLPSEYKSEQ